jgi:hypothetical protein
MGINEFLIEFSFIHGKDESIGFAHHSPLTVAFRSLGPKNTTHPSPLWRTVQDTQNPSKALLYRLKFACYENPL